MKKGLRLLGIWIACTFVAHMQADRIDPKDPMYRCFIEQIKEARRSYESTYENIQWRRAHERVDGTLPLLEASFLKKEIQAELVFYQEALSTMNFLTGDEEPLLGEAICIWLYSKRIIELSQLLEHPEPNPVALDQLGGLDVRHKEGRSICVPRRKEVRGL